VARLESVLTAYPEDVGGRLKRLERVGLVRRARTQPDVKSIVTSDLPELRPESSLLQAVLAEREENR